MDSTLNCLREKTTKVSSRQKKIGFRRKTTKKFVDKEEETKRFFFSAKKEQQRFFCSNGFAAKNTQRLFLQRIEKKIWTEFGSHCFRNRIKFKMMKQIVAFVIFCTKFELKGQ